MKYVKIILGVIATLAIMVGVIWILQGLNILPGSFMTGDIQWTYRGAGLAVVAAAVLWWSLRTAGVWKGIFGAFGGLMVLLGILWILQGVGILPGSMMSRHMEWAYRGAGLAAAGAVIAWVSTRKGRVTA